MTTTAWGWYQKCVDGCGAEAGCECMGDDDKPALVVCDGRVLHIPKVSQRPPDTRCAFCRAPVKASRIRQASPACKAPECQRARDRQKWAAQNDHRVDRQRLR